jgi:hypothetical protein
LQPTVRTGNQIPHFQFKRSDDLEKKIQTQGDRNRWKTSVKKRLPNPTRPTLPAEPRTKNLLHLAQRWPLVVLVAVTCRGRRARGRARDRSGSSDSDRSPVRMFCSVSPRFRASLDRDSTAAGAAPFIETLRERRRSIGRFICRKLIANIL